MLDGERVEERKIEHKKYDRTWVENYEMKKINLKLK
jgi:hypothetical protein